MRLELNSCPGLNLYHHSRVLLAGIQPSAPFWIPANRLDPEGVKRENEHAAGGQAVFQEASFGVHLLRDSLVVIPAIF